MWTLFGVSDLQGSLQGGGERPLRFRVPPIRTMLISSVEHWKTSTYRSFIVFLWHFWATINALSGDFIWMKASPEGRPCTDRGRNPINKWLNECVFVWSVSKSVGKIILTVHWAVLDLQILPLPIFYFLLCFILVTFTKLFLIFRDLRWRCKWKCCTAVIFKDSIKI